MNTALIIGLLAACLAVSYARYKSSDCTDAGEDCIHNLNYSCLLVQDRTAIFILSTERMEAVVGGRELMKQNKAGLKKKRT